MLYPTLIKGLIIFSKKVLNHNIGRLAFRSITPLQSQYNKVLITFYSI